LHLKQKVCSLYKVLKIVFNTKMTTENSLWYMKPDNLENSPKCKITFFFQKKKKKKKKKHFDKIVINNFILKIYILIYIMVIYFLYRYLYFNI